jgi:hypothetical protein
MNNDTDIELLDDSWITQFKTEENEYNNFYKETPVSVKLYFMYVNKENIIEIVKTEHYLLNTEGKIKKENVVSIIKKQGNTKYKLLSILKFNIDIEPEDVISNTCGDLNTHDNTYLSVEQYIQDIHFKDTVCIFHDINSLFFIFVERNDLMITSHNTRKSHSSATIRHHKTLKKRV